MMYLERLFCLKYQTQLALQHGGVYLVTMDTEFSYIIYTLCIVTDESFVARHAAQVAMHDTAPYKNCPLVQIK